MIGRIFSNFFYDPRKLAFAGGIASLLIMVSGFTAYRYDGYQYALMIMLTAFPLPLFALGRMDVRLSIEVPDYVGWLVVGLSMALIGYNIHLFGLPFLLVKALEGTDLDAPTTEYYQDQLRFATAWIALLTVSMPLSLCVRGRLLKTVMFFWPMLASIIIQVRHPFIFGLLFFLVVYQMLGRRIGIKLVGAMLALFLFVFIVVGYTRTGEALSTVAIALGVSDDWATLSPAIWFPLSYLSGPVTNALHIINHELFAFDLRPFEDLLPAIVLAVEDRPNILPLLTPQIPWAANNAVAAWGTFSYMFGVVGTVISSFAMIFILTFAGRSRAIANPWILAFFVVNIKNVMLAPIGNYFIFPTTTFEYFLLVGCFALARIRVGAADPLRVTENGKSTLPELVSTPPS